MTDKPNSTELINLAHREWKNRQERKGHDDEVAWTSGWISGYLTGRVTDVIPTMSQLEEMYAARIEDKLKKERIKTMGCIHAKLRAKFTLAVKEIDTFFESLRGEP